MEASKHKLQASKELNLCLIYSFKFIELILIYYLLTIFFYLKAHWSLEPITHWPHIIFPPLKLKTGMITVLNTIAKPPTGQCEYSMTLSVIIIK